MTIGLPLPAAAAAAAHASASAATAINGSDTRLGNLSDMQTSSPGRERAGRPARLR
jgi:hypothetical protein